MKSRYFRELARRPHTVFSLRVHALSSHLLISVSYSKGILSQWLSHPWHKEVTKEKAMMWILGFMVQNDTKTIRYSKHLLPARHIIYA